MSKNFDVKCSECEYQFKIDTPEIGEVISCPDCGLNLKIQELSESENIAILVLTENDSMDWGE